MNSKLGGIVRGKTSQIVTLPESFWPLHGPELDISESVPNQVLADEYADCILYPS